MIEEWRPALGYEGIYDVSSQGRIMRVEGGPGRYKTARLLKTHANVKTGYLTVFLARDGKKICRYVHHLVCEAFHGPRPAGMHCCHRDGIKKNCNADNLRWDTRSANELEKVQHGTSNRGERHGLAKLTSVQVLNIKQNLALGLTQRAIAKEFGVSAGCISDIARGNRWSWISEKAA